MAPRRRPVRKTSSAISYGYVMTIQASVRLTQYAHGGGCACKIPPGELEEIVAGLMPAGGGGDGEGGVRGDTATPAAETP